ncbi:MAG: AzlC family ABC transporter permease [Fretibacterium sp.]|nr:AzlC family ABC transporter permease [Fretibacterium sp.]
MKDVHRAFADTLPVMAGYVVLGIGFGILLSAKGYGAGWAFAMGVIIYSGALQYVVIDMISGGASLMAAALTGLMVSARHLFYGISMVDRYKGAGMKKPYMVYALTDETYSLVCSAEAPSPRRYHRYCFLVSLFDQAYWVGGSVIGGLLGPVIPFDTEGIDFALTALFVSICVDQWLGAKSRLPALTGFAAAAVCLLIFGREDFLIPAMLAITGGLTLLRPVLDKDDKDGRAAHD